MSSAAHVADCSPAPPLKKTAHGASVNLAFLRIRDLIVHGHMSPGSWIVERRLCEHLNLSRTPVRAALYQLQREGYVIEQRNGSKSHMVVAPITQDDAGDLYPILARLEGLAGRRAAALPLAERELLASELTEVNRCLFSLAGQGIVNGLEIFELDHKFHRLIVDAGPDSRLKKLHTSIEPQAERYWRVYAAAILSELHASVKEHDEIIAALIAGDADRLENAIAQNWENDHLRLANVIETFGERGSL
jgi:DNA-binding GntR family transcriptional regulator